MNRAIGRAYRAEEVAARGQRALEDAKRNCDEARNKVRLLEQNVQVTRDTKLASNREARDNCRELDRLAGIIADAKRAVAEALQVRKWI